MALYDLINGHQIQCFKNNLTNYENGEVVPLKTKSYSYEDSIIIIDTLNPTKKPFEKIIHIIRDSKVEASYQIGDITQNHCYGIVEYYTDTGKKVNIHSYNDIVRFLYEEYKLQLDIDFANIFYHNNKEVYNYVEALESEFYSKWYK